MITPVDNRGESRPITGNVKDTNSNIDTSKHQSLQNQQARASNLGLNITIKELIAKSFINKALNSKIT